MLFLDYLCGYGRLLGVVFDVLLVMSEKDLIDYFLSDIFVKVDCVVMVVSLEIWILLLDYCIVEFVFCIFMN